MSKERNASVNPCLASGCPGACCTNMLFKNVRADEAPIITGGHERIVDPQGFKRLIQKTFRTRANPPDEAAIYTLAIGNPNKRRTLDILVVGQCPNLGGAACTRYEVRPQPCRSFTFGSPECNKLRRTVGLPSV